MTASTIKLGWTLALASLALSCQVTRDPVITREYGFPPLLHGTLGSMQNVSVSGALWFGSFPSESDLDLAHRRGITTVIDLTAPDDERAYDVAGVCQSLGLELVPLGLACRDCLNDAVVDRAIDELRRKQGEPLLLYCSNGSRAAIVFAIYRCVVDGVPLDVALTEARRSGMKPGEPEEFVEAQVERLLR